MIDNLKPILELVATMFEPWLFLHMQPAILGHIQCQNLYVRYLCIYAIETEYE